jgi:putative transposase
VTAGNPVTAVVKHCGIRRSTLYSKRRQQSAQRGRRASESTRLTSGESVSNERVLEHLRSMLSGECEHYGYIKCTHALRQAGYCINHKKVYRLMKTHRLLNTHRRQSAPPRQYVRTRTVTPTRPMETVEMDIKFVYLHGEHRMAYLITLLDVFSRRALEQRFEHSIKATEVVECLCQLRFRWGQFGAIRLRTDNGAQFIARIVKDYCTTHAIEHEFIHPYTPQENGHIESFHSLLQREVILEQQFDSRQHAENILATWLDFYNNRRLHSGCGYRTPVAVWNEFWNTASSSGGGTIKQYAA